MALDTDQIVRIKQVNDDLFNFAGYRTSGSLSDVQSYVTALTRAIHLQPQMMASGGSGTGEEIRWDKQQLQAELESARGWLATKERSTRVAGGFVLRRLGRGSIGGSGGDACLR